MPLLIPILLMLGLAMTVRHRRGLMRLAIIAVAAALLVGLARLAIAAVLEGVGPMAVGSVVLMLLLILRPRRRHRTPTMPRMVRPYRRHGATRPPPLSPLEASWAMLGEIAPWSLSRINAARTSSARVLQAADASPLAFDLVEWREVMHRRIPELATRCRDGLPDAPGPARQEWIDGHLDLIERITAEADRRLARHRTVGDGLDRHRNWLDQHLGQTPLSPI